MDLSSISDDDQPGLYSRAAENVELRRKRMLESKKFDEEIILDNVDLDSDEVKRPMSDTAAEVILSETESNLRRSKRRKGLKPTEPKKSNVPKTTVKKQRKIRGRNSMPMRNLRETGVIILDDDTGYDISPVTPIDFNSRSKQQSTQSTIENGNEVSLNTTPTFSDGDEYSENDEVVNLSVEWHNGQGMTCKKFSLRRFEKLESVFEAFAKMEDLPSNRILLMRDSKTVTPKDTPKSLKLNYYAALTGCVSTSEIDYSNLNSSGEETENDSETFITVKMELESQKSLSFKIRPSEDKEVDILYKLCSEELKCDENKIRITFDGESVKSNDLFTDLKVEDGDVFHVYVKT